jgi:hypothetical protein
MVYFVCFVYSVYFVHSVCPACAFHKRGLGYRGSGPGKETDFAYKMFSGPFGPYTLGPGP